MSMFEYPTDCLSEPAYSVPGYIEPKPTPQETMVNEVVDEEMMRESTPVPIEFCFGASPRQKKTKKQIREAQVRAEAHLAGFT
jgi:hypothetical protein